jgi:hypothetical protein
MNHSGRIESKDIFSAGLKSGSVSKGSILFCQCKAKSGGEWQSMAGSDEKLKVVSQERVKSSRIFVQLPLK